MKNLIVTFIVLFLGSTYLFSQDLKGKRISVQAKSSVNETEFFLETTCDANNIKIKIKVKDSVSQNNLRSDSTFKVIMDSVGKSNFSSKNDTLMKLFKEMNLVIMSYTAYSVDSLYIPYQQFPAYKKLLNDIFNSSVAVLENIENNKGRIILDGTRMEFTLWKDEISILNAYAHSPSTLSHPLLYQYLVQTLGIYRQKKASTLLTKNRTSGY
jgi:hypothetical protein